MQQTTAPTPAPKATAAPIVADGTRQLIYKREEIRDQLKELARRRNELQELRSGLTSGPAAEMNARIAVIDRRSAQLETQLFATNDAIANGFGGPVVSEADIQGQLAELDASLSQTQDEAIRDAVSGAVDDAVFGAFATATTALLALFVAWRGVRRFIWKPKRPAGLSADSAQLEKLQQSLDVIAIEVERISEAQRYTAKMFNERGLTAGAAQPVPANQLEGARVR